MATITISTLPPTATIQDNSYLPIETNNVTQRVSGEALKQYIAALPEVTAETGAFTGAITADSGLIAANLSVGGTITSTAAVTGVLNATSINATNIVVDGLGVFAGNVSAPNFIAAQGVEAVSLKGTITTTLQPNIVGLGTLNSLAVLGGVTAGSITAAGSVTASAAGGFISATYQLNQRNPIWRFGTFPDYGISFFDATSGLDGQDTFGIHSGVATAAGSTLSVTDRGTLRLVSNRIGQRAYNFNWLQDTNGISAKQAYKLATLPASTEGTYDHIKLEGVFDSDWLSSNKHPFLITAGNRDGLSVQYIYGVSTAARIEFYQEPSGDVGVYAVLIANKFSSISVDVTSIVQATINTNITNIVNPVGTLLWSSASQVSILSSSATSSGVSDAADLTGTTLAANVTNSSLRSVGTLTNLYVSGPIVATSNVTVDIGSTTNWFRTIYGTSVQAQYADLAEVYASDAAYAPGTVLVFGGEAEVTESARANDRTVAGVVTTHPAYLMNAHALGSAVALQGRVPCRVTGDVKLGDMMVTSDIPGVAMASAEPKLGSVIGKALASHTGLDVGVIEVAVGRL